jgi:Glycosyltransferase family 87
MQDRFRIGAAVRGLMAAPPWFRGAMVLGALLRLYLCLMTQGTYDVSLWRGYSERIADVGLTRYYRENPLENHPPFIAVAESLAFRAGRASGIPFRVLLRLPFAILDAGTCGLLLLCLRGHARRFLLAALYWLHPLAIVLSSYHGNTDSAVAFCVLLSAWLLSRKHTLGGAVAVGVSLWIKLPAVLAVPALLLLLEGWRDLLLFGAVSGVTAISTYVPSLLADYRGVVQNVFGYHGQMIETTAGIPTWGWYRVLMPWFASPEWIEQPGQPVEFLVMQGWRIVLLLILFMVWRRRAQRTLPEVCVTIAASYALIYGLTENWSFQYFAWSVPFWFFTPIWFLAAASVFAGGYIYFLYAYLCGNPWLLGEWDFMGHPTWPAHVIALRDGSVLFFFAVAIGFLSCSLFKPEWFSASAASRRDAPPGAPVAPRGPKPRSRR